MQFVLPLVALAAVLVSAQEPNPDTGSKIQQSAGENAKDVSSDNRMMWGMNNEAELEQMGLSAAEIENFKQHIENADPKHAADIGIKPPSAESANTANQKDDGKSASSLRNSKILEGLHNAGKDEAGLSSLDDQSLKELLKDKSFRGMFDDDELEVLKNDFGNDEEWDNLIDLQKEPNKSQNSSDSSTKSLPSAKMTTAAKGNVSSTNCTHSTSESKGSSQRDSAGSSANGAAQGRWATAGGILLAISLLL